MKYNCLPCKYSTGHKGHYDAHTKTQIHNDKVILAEIKLAKTTKIATDSSQLIAKPANFTCNYCGGIFSKMFGLTRHKKVCVDKNSEIEKIKIEAETAKKQVETITETTKKQVEDLQKQIEYLKKQNDVLISKSNNGPNVTLIKTSSLNYVNNNYPNAPLLKAIDNFSFLHEDDEDFTDNVIYSQKKGKLDNFLSNIIYDNYKTTDPSEQQAWNTDPSRMTYLVRELIAKKPNWCIDKKGIITSEKMVKPLLKYVKQDIKKYLEDAKEKMNELTGSETQLILKHMEIAASIVCDIDNSTLADNIIRKMAPKFYLNKPDIDNNLLEL
jgi:hypothetical protein